jgi:sterol desaturase/sphingolipid hydroxylase (fatty acid hydroxylase superfamily)
MDEARFQIYKTSGFVASFVLIYAVQTLWPYARGKVLGRNWRQNLPLAAVNTFMLTTACGACLCSAALLAQSRGWGLFRIAKAPFWLALPVTVLALDFVLWAWHLANHRWRWLWRFHQVHHSDAEFDVTTSLRFHAGELLLSLPAKVATIFLLGAPILGILFFEMVFGLFNMFVHSNARLPEWIERRFSSLLVLPASHRLHHSIGLRDYNRNFGTILSLWDRWRGTWTEARSSDTIQTGLPGALHGPAPGFWRCLALPFRPLGNHASRDTNRAGAAG